MSDILVFLLCILGVSYGFMPDNFNAVSPSDMTHARLTELSVYYAAAEYVETVLWGRTKSGKSSKEIFDEYFKGDEASRRRFVENAQELGKRVATVKRNWPKSAARNMNGEEIMTANTLLQSFRKELIKKLNEEKWDIEEAINLVADYLYTLQEFYSSTNWVEMKGGVPYKDLGIARRPLIRTSVGTMFVCRSCSNYDPTQSHSDKDSCKGNIILNGQILTSGYKGDHSFSKPMAPTQYDEGKCSHGGKTDTSRFSKATGGINKETSNPEWSPHYYLHSAAAAAAQSASTDFFVGEDTGLVNHIPKETFEDLMSLHLGESIVFVIDDTGSMAAEIAAVREWTINKVKSTKGTAAAPYDYILSTFNDPETLNTIHSTRDPADMIDKLSKVNAHGGGDCPELAMHGIMAALKICRPYSTIFVFTDAPSKEESMGVAILNLANEKGVKITFLLTPGCSSKKRGLDIEGQRNKRSSGFDIYSQVAEETGGSVYHTTNANIAETLVVIDESLSSKPVEILDTVITATDEHPLRIPVDGQVSELTVEVSGVSNLADVQLFKPLGDEETFSQVDDTRSMISTTVVLLKKSAPTAGEWKLKRKAGTEVTVYVRGTGDISFRYTLRERASDGLLYPINGHPLADHKYTAAVTMDRGDNIQALHSLLLVTDKGEIIETVPITTTSTQSFTVTLGVTTEAFMLAVNGTDTAGVPFLRMVKKLIRPVSVKLEMLPSEGDFAAGKSLNITYSLVNEGTGTTTVNVELAHSEQVTSFSPVKTHSVPSKGSIEGHVTITAGTTQSLVHLKLTLKVGSEVLQEITRQMLIVDPHPPVCNVITTSNNCRNLLKTECDSLTWNATFEMNDEGFGLLRVYSSMNASLVKFSHDSFRNGYKGKVGGTLSGSCCYNDTKVHGEDLGGAVGSCFFTHEFRQPDVEPEEDNNTTVIALCVTGGILLIVVIIIIIIVIYKKRRRNYEKMT